MSKMWEYESTFNPAAEEWVDYAVQATDGEIGRISGLSTEAGAGCLVVQTGVWMFGKRRVLPAASITAVDDDAKVIHVALTKDQIKHAPDFEEGHSCDQAFLDRSEAYFTPHLTPNSR